MAAKVLFSALFVFVLMTSAQCSSISINSWNPDALPTDREMTDLVEIVFDAFENMYRTDPHYSEAVNQVVAGVAEMTIDPTITGPFLSEGIYPTLQTLRNKFEMPLTTIGLKMKALYETNATYATAVQIILRYQAQMFEELENSIVQPLRKNGFRSLLPRLA